jgi:hypothetical protein
MDSMREAPWESREAGGGALMDASGRQRFG